MPRRRYATLPASLEALADAVADDFGRRGYVVRVEHAAPGQPFVPTLTCARDRTEYYVEIEESVSRSRIEAIAAFARNQPGDTRVCWAVPEGAVVTGEDMALLRAAGGIGLLRVAGSQVRFEVQANDLALKLVLPERAQLPRRLRQVLGSSFDHFDSGNWREGFEEACKTLEEAARAHLKKWVRTGRIRLVGGQGPRRPKMKEIDKMTLGDLARAFETIEHQTYADNVLGQALSSINRDRVGVTHRKKRAITERRLRRNIGGHMRTVVTALREIPR